MGNSTVYRVIDGADTHFFLATDPLNSTNYFSIEKLNFQKEKQKKIFD